MPRYYVVNSSQFDVPPYYQAKRIAAIVKSAIGSHNKLVGGSKSTGNVRLSNYKGWSNQPQVVCFNAPTDGAAEIIAATVAKKLGRTSVFVRRKDW